MRKQRQRFRPMGIADILDETFEIYRSNFVLLIGISAVMYIPFSIFTSLYTKQPPERMGKEYLGYLIFVLISMLVMMFAERVVTGVLTYAISERYLGHQVTIVGSFRRILSPKVFFPLMGAIIVRYLAIAAPAMAGLCVVGIAAVATAASGTAGAIAGVSMVVVLMLGIVILSAYLGLRFALLEPVVIVEMKGVGNSLNRAWSLMRKEMMKALALLLIAWIIAKMIPGIIVSPTEFYASASQLNGTPTPISIVIIRTLLLAVVNTLAMPITSIVTIMLYYDIRIRKEGFDLEMLANELGSAAPEMTSTTGYQTLPQEQLPTQYPQEQPVQPQEPTPPVDFEL